MSTYGSLPQVNWSQQYPSSDLPENDISLLSYYLNCCVVGCQTSVDVPSDLLDYVNVHRLSPEYQHAVYRVAIHVFELESLLNKIIFVDDSNFILPEQTAHMFLPSALAAYWARFIPSFAGIPPTLEKIMICTSDWLRFFYSGPVARYSQALLLPRYAHSSFDVPAESNATNTSNNTNRKCKHFQNGQPYQSTDVQVEPDDCQNIPMAVAIPIEESRRSPHDEFCVSIFLPGQVVKLSGLSCLAMNDQLAIVQERSQDRVLVRVAGDPRHYSVKPENLVVVEDCVDF